MSDSKISFVESSQEYSPCRRSAGNAKNNAMIKDRERELGKFFDLVGWQTEGGVTEVARRWEDGREHVQRYASECRLRLLRHIPSSGENMLDVGSGPIQFVEFVEYSRNFNKRYCVDLSERALEGARSKIGDRGVYWRGSIVDIPLEDDFFDCTICIKMLFNIDKEQQEAVVRKLIRATQAGKPVIIVYNNPRPLWLLRKLRDFKSKRKARRVESREHGGARLSSQFHLHENAWWDRFCDVAEVKLLPSQALNAEVQRTLIPNNRFGAMLLNLLSSFEEMFPNLSVKYFQGLMIVLIKRPPVAAGAS
jgi:SAM-dependent methyltransferase